MQALTWMVAAALAQDLAARGAVVHPVAGPPIEDGLVLIEGGAITYVGPADGAALPAGVEVLEAAVISPGLVDAHTVVGMQGYENLGRANDQLDRSESMQPELRAIDAYDAREFLVGWVRSFGVTTLHTGHAPGALISGQTMVVKARGDTLDEALVRAPAMLAVTLGPGARGHDGASPGTRSKAVAMLRQALLDAGEYREALAGEEPPDRDLRKEALAAALAGELPLMITADRHQDLAAALRLAEEFDLEIVLDGAAEAYLITDRVRAAGAPVFVHPTMQRAGGDRENLAMTTPAALAAAGIPFAFQSGFEGYVPKTRVVLFEAGVAAAYGLAFEDALRALTLAPAEILGVADRVGSLEVGKDGDLALYDGDPFEYTTRCVGVVIEGEVVSDQPR